MNTQRQYFASFRAFYPCYLAEHANRSCRRLHYLGSVVALSCLVMGYATGQWGWLPMALVAGYGFAWIGHFVFEKNRPATFQHPLYSFAGDWVMFADMLRGRIKF